MKKYLILVFASALLFGGCAVEAVETIPEESVVVQTSPPYAGAVWIGAEYNWSRGRYVEVPAHWERSGGGQWQRGQWQKTRRGYRWNRGSWRK